MGGLVSIVSYSRPSLSVIVKTGCGTDGALHSTSGQYDSPSSNCGILFNYSTSSLGRHNAATMGTLVTSSVPAQHHSTLQG